MPCGSRNRRKTRRNRKRLQRPLTPLRDSLGMTNGNKSLMTGAPIVQNHLNKITGDDSAEAKINGNIIKVTTESLHSDALPIHDELSGEIERESRNKQYGLGQDLSINGTIYEITTLNNSAPEDEVVHISGVGILETGLSNSKDLLTTMTVAEPPEPGEMFRKEFESLDDYLFAFSTLENDKHSFEIHEITVTGNDTENNQSFVGLGDEADTRKDHSDYSEGSCVWEQDDDDLCESNMSREEEEKLRTFIDSLKLPLSPKLPRADLNSSSRTLRKLKKRLVLESYPSRSLEFRRSLDIIQEEAEKISDDEQYIRDFINEEISKYRRDDDNQKRRSGRVGRKNQGENQHLEIAGVVDENDERDIQRIVNAERIDFQLNPENEHLDFGVLVPLGHFNFKTVFETINQESLDALDYEKIHQKSNVEDEGLEATPNHHWISRRQDFPNQRILISTPVIEDRIVNDMNESKTTSRTQVLSLKPHKPLCTFAMYHLPQITESPPLDDLHPRIKRAPIRGKLKNLCIEPAGSLLECYPQGVTSFVHPSYLYEQIRNHFPENLESSMIRTIFINQKHSLNQRTIVPIHSENNIQIQLRRLFELKAVEFIKDSPILLSSQETTKRHLQKVLSGFDSERLPRNIRMIVQKAMAAVSTLNNIVGLCDIEANRNVLIEKTQAAIDNSPILIYSVTSNQPAKIFIENFEMNGKGCLKLTVSSSRFSDDIQNFSSNNQNIKDSQEDSQNVKDSQGHFTENHNKKNSQDNSSYNCRRIETQQESNSLENAIAVPKWCLFKNQQNILEFEAITGAEKIENREKSKSETWMRISTSVDPHLLLCLSPLQQNTKIQINPDRLLDLHSKFLNRRFYHDNQPQTISQLGSKVNLESMMNLPSFSDKRIKNGNDPHHKDHSSYSEDPDYRVKRIASEDPFSAKNTNSSTNRLLNIIRENPIPHSSKIYLENSQGRLKITRSTDYLNLTKQCAEMSVESNSFSRIPTAPHLVHGRINSTPGSGIAAEKFEEQQIKSLPIVHLHKISKKYLCSLTPPYKNPISIEDTIINKSLSLSEGVKTVTPQKNIDHRHNLNPALIDNKTEVPLKIKKSITVDRSCIDTTSVFAKFLPESHLKPEKEDRDLIKIMDRRGPRQLSSSEEKDIHGTIPIDFNMNLELNQDEFRSIVPKKKLKSTAFGVPTNGEVFRRQMFDEYVHKVLERKERKRHRVVKISSHYDIKKPDNFEGGNLTTVEREFMEKAKNRMNKFGIHLDDSDSETLSSIDQEKKDDDGMMKARCLVDGKEVKDIKNLPKHLQEFLQFSAKISGEENDGIWSPGSEATSPSKHTSPDRSKDENDSGIPPVWTPSSAGPSPIAERKEFRSVSFESPVLSRKNKTIVQASKEEATPRWESESEKKESSLNITSQNSTSRIVNSHSVPSQGLNTLVGAPRLPRAQNPTITLLQKAREGQLPRGAAYLDESQSTTRANTEEKFSINRSENVHKLEKQYDSEPEIERILQRKTADSEPRQFENIGPTTKDGIPVGLRSEIKGDSQAKWYKKMYDSLHRAPNNDNYVTIHYKPQRGTRYTHGNSLSGYLSEPESHGYSDRSSYDNHRRIRNKENEFVTTVPNKNDVLKFTSDYHKSQPGRIENYEPGKLTIAEKETKEWWDEVMDIFDGWLDENGHLHPDERRRFEKTTSETLSLSYRTSNSHSVRPPNLSSHINITEFKSGSRAQESKRENGIQDRIDKFDYLDPHPKLDKIRSNIARARFKSILDQTRSHGNLKLDLSKKLNRRDQSPKDDKSKTDSWTESSAGLILPLKQPNERYSSQPKENSKSSVLSSHLIPRSATQSRSRLTKLKDRTSFVPALESSHHQRTSPSTSCSSRTNHHITLLPSPSPLYSSSSMSPSRTFDSRNTRSTKPYMSQALKESGYESDSTLIFRRREDANPLSPLSPLEQRIAYKTVQRGGDVPLHGLRKPAPERPKDNDSEVEYFPIPPTQARIRQLEKNPLSSSFKSSMKYARYSKKSTLEYSINVGQQQADKSLQGGAVPKVSSPHRIPSPQRRKSHENNKIVQSNSLYNHPHSSNPRHKQCFVPDKVRSNMKSLKERFSCQLEKHRKQKKEAQISSRITRNTDSIKCKSGLPSTDSSNSRTRVSLSRSLDRICIRDSSSFKTKISESSKNLTKETTLKKAQFKAHRIKKDQEVSSKRSSKTVQSTKSLLKEKEKNRMVPPGTVSRTSTVPYSSIIGSERTKHLKDKFLRVRVSITPKAEKVLQGNEESREFVKSRTKSLQSLEESQKLQSSTASNSFSLCVRKEFETFKPDTDQRDTETTLSLSQIPKIINNNHHNNKMKDNGESRKMKGSVLEAFTFKSDRGRKSRRDRVDYPLKMKSLTNFREDETLKSRIRRTTNLGIEIKEGSEATRSDHFFQSLLLRNVSPTPFQSSTLRKSVVSKKIEMFQELGKQTSKSEPSLQHLYNYLRNKRPVSNSIFKNSETESFFSSCSSPHEVSWPGRSIFQKVGKFDSLLGIQDLGSSVSLRARSSDPTKDHKERSSSEPPLRTPSRQTLSRSPLPSSMRIPSDKNRNSRQERTEVPTLERIRKIRAKSASEAADSFQEKRLLFEFNLASIRSSSSLNTLPTNKEDYHQYIFELLHCKEKSDRYKDLHDFYASLEKIGKLEKTTSTGDLRPRIKNEKLMDYDRWKETRYLEKAHRELDILYGKLRVAQEKKDFLFRTKDIDKYKWRGDTGLRCKEKSVDIIREQFKKLANEGSELEASRQREIAFKKDIYKPLWRGDSVMNVANTLIRKAKEKTELERSSIMTSTLQKNLGGSKHFWSSLSIEQVNTLKNQLSEIYGSEDPKTRFMKGKEKSGDCVSNIVASGGVEDSTKKYEMVVLGDLKESKKSERDSKIDSNQLHVRCHSMIINKDQKGARAKRRRSVSISRVRSSERSESHQQSVPPMSELEKKRLSFRLGKEVLDKIQNKSVKPKETRNVIMTENLNKSKKPLSADVTDSFTLKIKDPESNLRVENLMEDLSEKAPCFVMFMSESSTPIAPSVSGFDSVTLSKTVVSEIESNKIPRKIGFYENIKDKNFFKDFETNKSKLSSSQSFTDLKDLFGEVKSAKYSFHEIRSRSTSPRIDSSVIRGKSPSALPIALNTRHFRSCSRDHDYDRPRSVSPYPTGVQTSSSCSLDSFWLRSTSPDPEQYWRTYLKLVKNGTVKKLREEFESLEDLSSSRKKILPKPRRFQSDPELTRDLLKKVTQVQKSFIIKPQEIADIALLRRRFEPVRGRARRRFNSPPIPRVPLRVEDLEMPHINFISKMAELKDASHHRSSSSIALMEETKQLEAEHPVGRVRKYFENSQESNETPILGKMFTSTSSVHELKDITPHLAGTWVAHKYPNRHDNARSWSSPPDLNGDGDGGGGSDNGHGDNYSRGTFSKSGSISPPRRKRRSQKPEKHRGNTASSLKSKVPVSILKQPQTDIFANQPFDPSIHRPKYRYQPPPPPPSPAARRDSRIWWPSLPTYTARPTTVTFEEYSIAPQPPPKSHHYRGDYQESPRKYVEGEVTIHYRSPVRVEAKDPLSEEELARRSAENMRRVYQEERRRKYLQELHDIDSRRHTDNFIPSQKSPIPLNRYDDFVDDLSQRSKSQEQTPEPRLVARALYNFIGQSPRELTFRRGDLIFVRRQIDKNWYEGEHNAMIGLFPFNYVEIIPYDGIRTTPKKPHEGQARAKFNFIAQTNLELSLAKGDIVVLIRRVDENWYEGRLGNRKGIFPISYVEVISEPGLRPETPVQSKPIVPRATHNSLFNESTGSKMSIGSHNYSQMLINSSSSQSHYNSLPRIGSNRFHFPPDDILHIDTHTEATPYRALYNYRPQNEDELELKEGDTVFVFEKCDDGWYVGSSQRTGYFGTFPGNYVERL